MDAARLAAWSARDRERRAAAAPVFGRWLTGVRGALALGALIGVALAALAWHVGVGEATTWWRLVVCVGAAAIAMRAPHRMYWRPDAALQARLPIPGASLYALAARRSWRAGALVALALAVATVGLAVGSTASPLAELMPADVALGLARQLGLVATGALAGALAAAPVGALAGVLVSSEKAQQGLASVAGEAGGPPLIWLSLLPGLAGAGLFVPLWLAAPAAISGDVSVVADALPLAAVVVACALAEPLARARLAAGLTDATREVAALDAVKLAHLELDRARGLEALVGGALAGGGLAGAFYRKDVALARRRHPLYFLSAGLGLLVLWGVAAFGAPDVRARWTIGVVAALAAYLVVFGRRLAHEPIERPRLVGVLPVPAGAVARAKWAFVAWRALFLLGAAAPAIVRSAAPLELGGTVVGLLVAATLLAGRAARVHPDAPVAPVVTE